MAYKYQIGPSILRSQDEAAIRAALHLSGHLSPIIQASAAEQGDVRASQRLAIEEQREAQAEIAIEPTLVVRESSGPVRTA